MPFRHASGNWSRSILIVGLLAVASTQAGSTAAAPGTTLDSGDVFRSSARAFLDCLDAQSRVSLDRREPAMIYADRIYLACAAEMDAFAAAAREGGVDRPRRIRGAIRAAISDSVIGYEARAAFAR